MSPPPAPGHGGMISWKYASIPCQPVPHPAPGIRSRPEMTSSPGPAGHPCRPGCACGPIRACSAWPAGPSWWAGRRCGCCASARAAPRWPAGGGTGCRCPAGPPRRNWRGACSTPGSPTRTRPGGPEPDEVTAVIPVRDRPAELARCLAGLDGMRVIVVDDGSADRAAVAAAAAAAGALCLRRDRCGGAGAARNTGLAAVRTPLVAFVDSDCVPRPGWLSPLLRHFADPAVGAVAPRIRAHEPGQRLAGAVRGGRVGPRHGAGGEHRPAGGAGAVRAGRGAAGPPGRRGPRVR